MPLLLSGILPSAVRTQEENAPQGRGLQEFIVVGCRRQGVDDDIDDK